MQTRVFGVALEKYYLRTYGDPLAIRIGSVALVAGLTAYLGIWPWTVSGLWATGYLLGELLLILWWKKAQPSLAKDEDAQNRIISKQLVGISAAISAFSAIPALISPFHGQVGCIVGAFVSAGIILIIAAQHSLNKNMFLVTSPVAIVSLIWNLASLGQGELFWIYAVLGVGFVINARFLQVTNAEAFQELIEHQGRAAEALKRSLESEGLYQLLADNQTDMVALWDDDGTLIYGSPSLERTFGYGNDDRKSLSSFRNLHPDDEQRIMDLVEGLSEGSGVVTDEFRLLHRDGSEIWVESAFQRLNDGSNKLLATARVITQRKVLEKDLRLALEETRKTQSLARMAEELAGVGYWRRDIASSVSTWSPGVFAIYDMDPAEGVPPQGALDRFAPEDRQLFSASSVQALQDGQPYSVEAGIIRTDGERRIIQLSGAAERDSAGQITSLFGVIIDVTEARLREQELIRKRDEAEAAIVAKTEFLANMTHELRTPLNAIIGFTGLLRGAADLKPPQARQVELIWDAGQSLLGVVNDVLDFSKLEAGAVEFEAQVFDPFALAQSSLSLLAGQAAAKGLKVAAESDGSEGLLLGDSTHLRQVLTNFISNAVKFTARGEVRVSVSQVAVGEVRKLRIAVKDTGIGVAAEQMDSIFGRFTQADASVSREFGGTGLGLAISKRIIEAMNGEIGVESVIGQGSTFWFEVVLPLAPLEIADAPEEGPPIDVQGSLRLLVVDDNAVNRELVCALLDPFDVIIDTANDGVEAVESASRTAYDLILMDVQMPNMDGLTATRRIRDTAPAGEARTPIIAMTANVLPEQVQRCLDAGMDDHIGKPINPTMLLEAIMRWTAQAETGDADAGAEDLGDQAQSAS